MPTEVDLFRKPPAELPLTLADGTEPRGLTAQGWVRTTGWLQVGDNPVSSAHIAAVLGLLWAPAGARLLVSTMPVAAGIVVLTAPVLCGVSWWLFTRWVRPASKACNVATKHAEELSPGDLVRLYGSIGPVGQVTAVTFEDYVRVTFHGGSHQLWPRRQVVQIVELLS